jgi:hypothetical protein
MLQRLRPFLVGLVTFATTGIVILDYPALAGFPLIA